MEMANTAAVATPRAAAITTVPVSADNSAALPPQPRPARNTGNGAR